ncbi:MAG: hypothetical protein A2033_13465 [Bacteroidetes bacterium GWA2_31_9]|nr:MAG: hypothetical protein A2033_13465 [Bacteroidetes bacterium GWA2_31_9]
MIKYFTFFILIFSYSFLKAQNTNLPFDLFIYSDLEENINYKHLSIHGSLKPLEPHYLNTKINSDSIFYLFGRDSLILSKLKHKWLWKKLRTEDLVIGKTKDFIIQANVIVDFEKGKDFTTDSILSTNSRGVIIKGQIGKRFYFQTLAVENQAFVPDYMKEYIKNNHVMPGLARLRIFKGSGYDYSYSNSYINYVPVDNFSIQFGHGKNFIGNGHRSLLLSDYSAAYPFLKFLFQNKRIQYMYMMNSFQEISSFDTKTIVYNRNHGSFSYLNIIVNKYLQVGLFEGTVWKTSGIGYNNKFKPNYFNPLIFYKAINYGFNDSNNVLLGFNIQIIPQKNIQLYGQLVVDDYTFGKDFNQNKTGYQAGIKIFKPFNIKRLFLLCEYNRVNPFTYSHDIIRQNYTHFNMPLAHPAGANLKELVLKINYKFKDFGIELGYNNFTMGNDSAGINFGGNLFNYFDNYESSNFLQGLKTTTKYYTATLSYLINPAINCRLFVSVVKRTNSYYSVEKNSNLIYFGIRTNIFNRSLDFI